MPSRTNATAPRSATTEEFARLGEVPLVDVEQRGMIENVGLEPAYLQVMLGAARPGLMGYADADLQKQRDVHLKSSRA